MNKIDNQHKLEKSNKRSGLSALTGKWKGFSEISDDIEAARSKDIKNINYPLMKMNRLLDH
ncbi:MAG: hypothetical protein ACYTFY_09950 [Planctomycetota bacterium]|jgi:hypothetical protein